ncbi:MAG TPA: DUF445 family protein [Spirochaetia bacterium]|nr:DUF445 family protein [Spirochaetia bacterium]
MRSRNRIGLVSLAVAAAGFLFVTFQPWFPLERVALFRGLSLRTLLSSFFDASLVGALADWFAVSALFRSPLGIRLPHTDILARNQAAIADAVPRFLGSFVSEQTIGAELSGVDFAGNVERLLADAGARGELHDLVRSRLQALLAAAVRDGGEPSEGFAAGVREVVRLLAERVDAASAASALIRWALDNEVDQRIFGAAASALHALVEANQEPLTEMLTQLVRRNAGWQGLFVGRGTMTRLLAGLQQEIARFGRERQHELRLILERHLRDLARRLGAEAGGPARDAAQAGFQRLAADPATADAVSRLLAAAAARLRTALEPAQTGFDQSVDRLEESFLYQLAANHDFRRRFNEGVAGLISSLVARSRLVEGVTGYLSALLANTDVREFVGRVEEAVWNDLQYIRVNGAVVGGLVGVVLAVVRGIS